MTQSRSITKFFTIPLIIIAAIAGSFLWGITQVHADANYEILLNKIPDSGYIFLAPSGLADNPAVPHAGGHLRSHDERKLEIRKPNGQIIEQYSIPAGQEAGNFQLQKYRAKPVFTWWQGKNQSGHGLGDYYVSDTHFHILKHFRLDISQGGDLHEFRFLSDHTAAVSGYHIVIDPHSQRHIFAGVFSIINLDTGSVIFTWNSLEHVPLSASYISVPHDMHTPYDYFHINSIILSPHGNYLISSRNTSALYKIDAHTGAILWKIGGKNPTFPSGPGAEFSYQHDAQFIDSQTIRLFDNANQDTHTHNPSSVLWLKLDTASHRVTLVKRWEYPHALSVWAMGNAQGLSHGGIFGGWGTSGHIGEFNAQGVLVYDAYLPDATTYRAFFYPSLD